MTESTEFLFFLFASPSHRQHSCFRTEQEWEGGTLQHRLPWKVFLPWSWALWAQYSEGTRHASFLLPIWQMTWIVQQHTFPLPNFVLWPSSVLLNLFHFLKHTMLFLAPGFALMGTPFLSPLLMNFGLPSKSQLGWHFSDPPGWWLRCPCYVLLWGAYLSHLDCNLSPPNSCKSWDTELSLSCSQTCIKVG